MKFKNLFIFSIIAAVVGLAEIAPAWSSEFRIGLVIENTFLISEQANFRRNNKLVHNLVGYLPTGTRVYYKNERRTINNLTEGNPEFYYKVFSSIGIDGLIREDFLIPIEGQNRIAKVIDTIWLHNPDPAKGKFKKLLQIGRYDNAYLEITDEDDAHYYANLIRRERTADLPEKEPVRLWKQFVYQEQVIMVEPQSFDEENLPAPKWSSTTGLDNGSIKKIIDKIENKLGTIDKAHSFLQGIDSWQCLLSVNANAELGLKLLGNGLSFDLDMSLLNQDQMIRLTKRTLILKRNEPVNYIVMQNVKCDGGNPERLIRFTLQEGVIEFGKRASVRLQDLVESESKWVTSLQGSQVLPYKMVRIANEQNYIKILDKLNKLVIAGHSFINEKSQQDQEILLNFILREISYFEHRDNLVSLPNS